MEKLLAGLIMIFAVIAALGAGLSLATKSKLDTMAVSNATVTASAKPTLVSNNLSGVITPELATGFLRTSRLGLDTDSLEAFICLPIYTWTQNSVGKTQCMDKQKNNMFRKMKDAIPDGKTYVGFKSMGEGNVQYVEIYWKDKVK